MIDIRIDIPRDEIEGFCRWWRVREMCIFGSAVRDDFSADSDLDVLVSFEADAHWGVFDLVHMEDELARIMKRRVDLVEREVVERSENYIRRRHILESAERVYVA